jgi:hypothetical protein
MLEGSQCAVTKLIARVVLVRVAKCMLKTTVVYINLTARPLALQRR